MTNKVILVTPPDDVLYDGFRILLVSLDQTQTQMLSSALYAIEDLPSTIVYIYNPGDDTDWLFDKKLKSNIIIFDADSADQALVGYLTAQKNSYHFGDQKTLRKIANSAIYDMHGLKQILEEQISKHV